MTETLVGVLGLVFLMGTAVFVYLWRNPRPPETGKSPAGSALIPESPRAASRPTAPRATAIGAER